MSKTNYNLFVGVSKDDQKKMKDDVKTELKQHKAEIKQKEKDQKAEEKQKEKELKAAKKASPSSNGSSSPLVPTRANAGPSFFGLHWSKGGCGDSAITFVQRCITWLEEPGKGRLTETGIYRLSGSHSSVQRLKQMFSADPTSHLSEDEEVHDVTGVLKLYFREMPEPIIPYTIYDAFITAAQIDENRAQTLQQLISLLPFENRIMFTLLFAHLNNVAIAANSMDAKNLAIVFAPNIFRPQEDNPELVLADAQFATELVIAFTTNPSHYIPDLAPKQSASSSVAPVSRPPVSKKSDLDEQIEKYDPFTVANYITYYQSQGYDAENAKKWALYYLQQQAPQAQAAASQPQQPQYSALQTQVSQVQQAPANHSSQNSGGGVISSRPTPQQQGFSYSRPQPTPPSQNTAAPSNHTSAYSQQNNSAQSNTAPAYSQQTQQNPQITASYAAPSYSATQAPAPNAYASPASPAATSSPHPQLNRNQTTTEYNYPQRQAPSGSGALTPPTSPQNPPPASPTKRSSGYSLAPASGNQISGASPRQLPLPPQSAERNSPKASPRNSHVEDGLPPQTPSSEKLNVPAVISPPRPRMLPSPTIGSANQTGGAGQAPQEAGPISPRPTLLHVESTSRPPRPQLPPPNAPSFANKIQERVVAQQRIRGQSISQMRQKMGAQNDDEYKQKMMAMMNEYRSGNAGVLQDIQ